MPAGRSPEERQRDEANGDANPTTQAAGVPPLACACRLERLHSCGENLAGQVLQDYGFATKRTPRPVAQAASGSSVKPAAASTASGGIGSSA